MISCLACGHLNRSGARYCQQCGGAIGDEGRQPAAATTPGESQENNLASSAGIATQALAGASSDQHGPEESPDDGPLAVGTILDDSYVVQALLAETEGMRTYRATLVEPWRRCAYCGTAGQPDDPFCQNCGAQLANQTVLLQETSSEEPAGAALIANLPADEVAQSALPPLLDVFTIQGRHYAVLAHAGHATLTPFSAFFGEEGPTLDEDDTLEVGLLLARTLALIHVHGLALGRLRLADLGLTVDRRPRLADASALRISHGPADQADDLQQLVEVLERLAGIERKTQRLADGAEPADEPATNGLSDILRRVRTGAIGDAAGLAQAIESLIAERTQLRPLRMRTGYATSVGMVRSINEDSLLTWDLRMIQNSQLLNVGLYIVADGMGGHEGGEIASGLAVTTVAQALLPVLLDPALRSGPIDTGSIADLLRRAVQQASMAIADEAQRRGNDMGTTMTLAVVIGDYAIVGNVGDSRAYLYQQGQLRRITRDHSLVMRLVEAGQITEDEIYTHPNRNAILRSLGDNSKIEVDIFEERLEPGDALLLCSDGLWEMVRDPQILAIIDQSGEGAHDACHALIDAANTAGGEDNITAVLVRFATAEAPDEAAQA